MRIIPVLDLMAGKVVQGIGGERKKYEPLKDSAISSSAEPFIVAKSFQEKLGLNWLYIADLDQIQESAATMTTAGITPTSETLAEFRTKRVTAETNETQIKKIATDPRFEVMLDGGCQTLEDVSKLLSLGVDQAILATETLASLEVLKRAVENYGPEKILLSIDFMEGSLLASSPKVKKHSPVKIAKVAEEEAIKAIIVLELRKVGSQGGPLNESLLKISSVVSNIPVFAGGGVRSKEDLRVLQKKGIAGALIATAFHKGTISREDLTKFSERRFS